MFENEYCTLTLEQQSNSKKVNGTIDTGQRK
jgi:hypothetical protein